MSTHHDHSGPDLPVLDRLLHDLTWDMPAESQRRLKDHLVSEFRRAEPGAAHRGCRWRRPRLRPRTWLVLGTSAALAGVAAAAIVISTATESLPPPSPAAVQLLAKVARAAGRQPTPRVSDSQYTYVQTKDVSWIVPGNLRPYLAAGSPPRSVRARLEKLRPWRTSAQIWSPVADVCQVGLERITMPDGQVDNEKFSLEGPGTKCPNEGGLNDATYRLLQRLPTDPHALLAMIYRLEQGHGPGPDQEAFVTIGDLLGDRVAPPRVAAALYQAAALIPGVSLIPDATDAIGRHGVAVAQTADGIRTELIFRRTGLQLIGERTVIASIGMSTSATAFIREGFADHVGQVPPAGAATSGR